MNSYGKYEAIKYTLDDGAYKPERQHRSDAGIDLRSMYDYVIYPHDCKAIETGVHFEIPLDHVGIVKSRSGMNFKNHVITLDGVIDCNYRGSVRVMLYNLGEEVFRVSKGDRVSQMVITPCSFSQPFEVSKLNDTDRGNDGFGSTGQD